MRGSVSMSSQTTGPAVKSSSWITAFCFHDSGSFMNGCSGSGATNLPLSAINRKTSESVDSSNNHKTTLCAFRRRPIVLSICPRNFSGSGAVAKTSRLWASASTCPRATCSEARSASSERLLSVTSITVPTNSTRLPASSQTGGSSATPEHHDRGAGEGAGDEREEVSDVPVPRRAVFATEPVTGAFEDTRSQTEPPQNRTVPSVPTPTGICCDDAYA